MEFKSPEQEIRDLIESIIDKSKLSEFLYAVAEVCSEKAQHIMENWQGQVLVSEWSIACGKIENLSKELKGL